MNRVFVTFVWLFYFAMIAISLPEKSMLLAFVGVPLLGLTAIIAFGGGNLSERLDAAQWFGVTAVLVPFAFVVFGFWMLKYVP